MTISKYPSPVKITLPKLQNRESNAIYKWFQHQQGVENLEHKVAILKAELKSCEEALKDRRKQLKKIKAEVTGVEEIEG